MLFQQSPATTVDDLVITARAADGLSSVRLEIAVRRAPKFIKSDKKTNDLILALVRADLAAKRASDPLTERRLAVALSGHTSHAREVAELAVVARGQSSAEEFFDLVTTPRKFATSARLTHLRAMVAAALARIDDPQTGDLAWVVR